MVTVDGVEMLDIREAADLVGRTPETVRRWVWSGRLSARRQGNRLLVARADVQRLVDDRGKSPPTSGAPTLAEWAAEVREHRRWGLLGDTATLQTASDLVLDDRLVRDER
jgi:excisionase family DNA binding protein